MDFLLDPLLHDLFLSDVSLLAFLKQIRGWAYYTVWTADAPHHPQLIPGLTWSRGQVNESLTTDHENNLSKDCKSMGLLLQAFYERCSFLPLGSGSMAGKAFATGQCQWASGEELLMQIRFLSDQNQKPPPPGLQALYFEKHPKVAILESTIHYLKELKARIHELEQENVSLINIKLKSKSNSTKDVCNLLSNLEHATNGKGSIQGKVYNKSAIGHCIYSSSAENTIPYFQFILTKNVQDIKANATINGILNSLQSKNLCCYEINYEFCKNANKLFINILANYKDGENQSPSLDVIEGIKEWWNNLIKD